MKPLCSFAVQNRLTRRSILLAGAGALYLGLLLPNSAHAETTTTTDGVTTIVTNGGDDSSYQIPLTVPVVFDGVTYNNVYATTNSVITFGNPDGTYWTYPQTPSVSIESRDWWALPYQMPDTHFIISVSAGGFQVDGTYRPFGTWSGDTTNIVITGQILTNGTVAYVYNVTGPTYPDDRNGVRLNDGTIVTLEQAGLIQATVPVELNAAPVETVVTTPDPTPTPDPLPEPQPEPQPQPAPYVPYHGAPDVSPAPQDTTAPEDSASNQDETQTDATDVTPAPDTSPTDSTPVTDSSSTSQADSTSGQTQQSQSNSNTTVAPSTSPDSLPDTVPLVPSQDLLVPHIQEDVAGVDNGGIEFFGTKDQPQVIGEDGKLTPPPPPPGSGLPIPADAITIPATFIGQPGGVTFNSPDVAVPVKMTYVCHTVTNDGGNTVHLDVNGNEHSIDQCTFLPGAIDAIPGAGEAIQAIGAAYTALANIGNDMSPITRKKAKKVLVATIVGGVLFRRRFGE